MVSISRATGATDGTWSTAYFTITKTVCMDSAPSKTTVAGSYAGSVMKARILLAVRLVATTRL